MIDHRCKRCACCAYVEYMIIDHIGKEEYFARVVFLYSFLFRECFHAGGFAISAAAKGGICGRNWERR